jgi:acyl-coenzyme A thioesterase PaaI-like protein
MATLDAELADVAAGRVAIGVPIEPRLSQQDGFLHAGVVVTALDSACGYAALTLMQDDAEVLTVELKGQPAGAGQRRPPRRRGRGRPRRSHADRLPGRRVRRAGRRARARRDDAGDHGAPEQRMSAIVNQLTDLRFLDGYRVEIIERPAVS